MTEESSVSINKNFCECNCGTEIPIGRRFVHNHHFRGERNVKYKGYRSIDPKGYLLFRKKDHKFADNKGYVREHRIIWEEHYKACLLPWADVHHINKIITDNRIENLEAMMHGKHTFLTNHLDVSDRICAVCNGKTCIRPNGKEVWYKYNLDKWICNKCYWYKKGKKKRLIM